MSTAIIEVHDITLDGLMSGASLLFNEGSRPDRLAVRALALRDREFAISLEPDLPPPPDQDGRGDWIELVIHGLTFDLAGLAPRADTEVPAPAHLFGLSREFPQIPHEAVTLVPGPHLAGGRQLLPVLRAQALLTARLAVLPGVAAVAWHGARAWSAPEYFRAGVLRWVEGGAFPGLGLAALAETLDGGIASEGLALFTGQEVVLDPSIAEDRAAAARTALRLMHWLVENGAVSEPETLTGPSGELLRLEPSANRLHLKVWRI